MKSFINFPKVEGNASRQAHADLPEGTYEREMSKEGFFGPSALLHHKRPPTGWIDWSGPLRPRAFDLNKLQSEVDCPWSGNDILYNQHCRISMWRSARKMDHLVRNGDGDQLLFVHRGNGELFCDFGRLSFEMGDYIVLPRGTMWRMECDSDSDFLMIEATNSSFGLPDRGIVGSHAFFDPAMLDTPCIDQKFLDQQTPEKTKENWQVRVKRHNTISIITYPYNPLDVVGWHGTLMPVKINIKHFRPLMSHRYHLPPSAHTTFLANRFVVCTFCPRPFEQDPKALKVPFFHNNDDYDEVLFYHKGDFFSRDNIKAGTITFHPSGFTHGPHPKALENMLKPKKMETDEYAVMVDTRDALETGDIVTDIENPSYAFSWQEPGDSAS
ncbi:MAG: homogentisate 1,2-dioxygenase [Rhodospirillaceae bacterium]|nr:homogentisate 1,2-dioxygenase [Rhodospirillaceae bacterium]|tara:strand:- start:1252 stop:2403 length:1152 start_codon:yes stop_codon:yes gene_type:complete